MQFKNILLVFVGGGMGSVVRYGIASVFSGKFEGRPWVATLLINLIACLLLGYYLESAWNRQAGALTMRLLIATGFCGGLSTFSTFAFETWFLFRAGQVGTAFFNLALSMVLGLLAIGFGVILAKA